MPKKIDKTIGRRIRKTRESRGYSREVCAERADLSPTFLASIELGSKGFSENTLIRLCRVLCVSADFLLFGRENTPGHDVLNAMLCTLDKQYLPQLEALLAAYINSIQLAENTTQPQAKAD